MKVFLSIIGIFISLHSLFASSNESISLDSIFRNAIHSIDYNMVNKVFTDSVISDFKDLNRFNFRIRNNKKIIIYSENDSVKKIRTLNKNGTLSTDLYLFDKKDFLYVLLHEKSEDTYSSGFFIYDKLNNIWLFIALDELPFNLYNHNQFNDDSNLISIFLVDKEFRPISRINFIHSTFATYSNVFFTKNNNIFYEQISIPKYDINLKELQYHDVLNMLIYGFVDRDIIVLKSREYIFEDLQYWLYSKWRYYDLSPLRPK